MGVSKGVMLMMSIFLIIGIQTKEIKANTSCDRKMFMKEQHVNQNTNNINKNRHGHGQRHGQGHVYAHAHADAHEGAHPKDTDCTNTQVPSTQILNVDSTKIVNSLCATATYKDACIKTLTTLSTTTINNNPTELFKSGVNLALENIKKASSLPNTLLPKATTKRANSAIKSCQELLEQSMERLKMVSEQLGSSVDLVKTLKDPNNVFNLRLELGDVNTFSTNCLDEFGEAEDPQLQTVMHDCINNVQELAVNLLDIVSTYNF